MSIEYLIKRIENDEARVFGNNGFIIYTDIEPKLSRGGAKIEKKDGDVSFKFYLTVKELSEGFEVGVSSGRVTFISVEEITLPILIKNGLLGESALEDPITFVPPFQKAIERIAIKTENEFEKIIGYLKVHVEKRIINIVNEYHHLDNLSIFLNSIPQKEISNYIPKGVYKKATIWKLCKNPKYDEYINWLYTGMTKRAKNYPDNIDHQNTANAVRDLKERLKSLA